MNTFKVGDKVRVIDPTEGLPRGFETEVISIDNLNFLSEPRIEVLNKKGDPRLFYLDRFELIMDKHTTEDGFEVKSGMIFETDGGYNNYGFFIDINGKLFTVHADSDGKRDTWGTVKSILPRVIKLYQPLDSVSLLTQHMSKKCTAKLVWEKKPAIVELTIDQIAEKFGVKPEQIKIKKVNSKTS